LTFSLLSRYSIYVETILKSERYPVIQLLEEGAMREEISLPVSAAYIKNAAFYAYSPEVAEALQALKDEDWQVRMAAATVLEGIGPRARLAVPTLIQTLEEDEREDVRQAAAEALGGVGLATTEAISALVRALDDRSDYVRWAAAKALDAFTRQGVSGGPSN
jgi:HEAT repeat protein